MKSISDKILAGYPGLYLLTHEESRAEAMLKSIAEQINFNLHAWSCTMGRIDALSGISHGESGEPIEVLQSIPGLPERTIIVLRDFHLCLADPEPAVYRLLKDALAISKTRNVCIVILSAILRLPPEFEKLFTVVEFQLPTREELRQVLDGVTAGVQVQDIGNGCGSGHG